MSEIKVDKKINQLLLVNIAGDLLPKNLNFNLKLDKTEQNPPLSFKNYEDKVRQKIIQTTNLYTANLKDLREEGKKIDAIILKIQEYYNKILEIYKNQFPPVFEELINDFDNLFKDKIKAYPFQNFDLIYRFFSYFITADNLIGLDQNEIQEYLKDIKAEFYKEFENQNFHNELTYQANFFSSFIKSSPAVKESNKDDFFKKRLIEIKKNISKQFNLESNDNLGISGLLDVKKKQESDSSSYDDHEDEDFLNFEQENFFNGFTKEGVQNLLENNLHGAEFLNAYIKIKNGSSALTHNKIIQQLIFHGTKKAKHLEIKIEDKEYNIEIFLIDYTLPENYKIGNTKNQINEESYTKNYEKYKENDYSENEEREENVETFFDENLYLKLAINIYPTKNKS